MGIFYLTDLTETPNMNKRFSSKQTMGAKIHSQEGYSPDYLLRSLKTIKCKKCEKMMTIDR